ncbi:hypothetical protein BKA93DRAFT_812772 [Sparassis latifolia]
MSHTKNIHFLPPELYPHIAESLIDDRRSLRAFALTCRAWRAVGQGFLFRRISVTGERRFYELMWLLDAHPEAGVWIHELCVSTLFERPQNDWIYTIPVLLPTRLTALHTLTFRNVTDLMEYDEEKFFPGLSPAFPSIRTLNVMDCTLPLAAFIDYLSLLRNLDSLLIEGFRLPNTVTVRRDFTSQEHPWEGLVVPSSSCVARLRSFALCRSSTHACPTNNFVRWLGHASGLRSLSLDINRHQDLQNVGRLINAIGPSLENLGLGIYTQDYSFTEYINLSSCTSLRTFALRPSHFSPIPLLSQLVSPHLRKITLIDILERHIHPPLCALFRKSVFAAVEIFIVSTRCKEFSEPMMCMMAELSAHLIYSQNRLLLEH